MNYASCSLPITFCFFGLSSAAPAASPVSPVQDTQVLYATDFTDLSDWTVVLLCGTEYRWNADATPTLPNGSFRSAPHSLNFNNGIDYGGPGGFSGGERTCGEARSPVINLALATGAPELQLWTKINTEPCHLDELKVRVEPAAGGEPYYNECIAPLVATPTSTWAPSVIPLDAAWGEVHVVISFDTQDDLVNDQEGPFIDDFSVFGECTPATTAHCFGFPREGSTEGASLAVATSSSIATTSLQLIGGNFHPNEFAALFAGPTPAVIGIGNGLRCIAGAGSARLGVAPTRDFGEPRWNVDLASSSLPVLAGSTWFFQSAFRDEMSVNFSDAIWVRFCD